MFPYVTVSGRRRTVGLLAVALVWFVLLVAYLTNEHIILDQGKG